MRSETPTLAGSIDDLITQLFPTGLKTATRTRWDNVKARAARDAGGAPSTALKAQLNSLVAFMQQQEPRLNHPLGEARQHALTRLTLQMLMYVYEGPDTPPPPVVTTNEFGFGIVSPTATSPTVVQTTSEQAVVEFPAGSVDEETVVILEQNTTPYPKNCTGPMTTRRCQYPLFYRAHVFPEKRLKLPAKAAICHVNSGSSRLPLRGGDFHDRFRLAHDRPADPANYSDGATQEDGIEILKHVHVDASLMDCSGGTDYDVAFVRSRPGALGNLLDRTEWLARSAVARAGRLLTPRTAFAIDQGGGGLILFFSNIGVVDPASQPDLKPETFTLQESELFVGETAVITALATTNVGTASAGGTTASIRLSSDESITTEDLELASQAVAPVVPDEVITGAPLTVEIPESTAPGTYYLGMLSDAGAAEEEEDEANNFTSVRVTIRRRPSTMVVACGAGPFVYSGDPHTPCEATLTTGTVISHPAVTYANNTEAGEATASAAFAGNVRYEPSEASTTFMISRAPTHTEVECPPFVEYTGTPRTPCTATVTGPVLSAPVPVTYANNVNSGVATATATFPGGPNHLASTGTSSFEIIGHLLGTSGNDGGGADLVRIDPTTGASTPIGNVGPFVMPGLAFDPTTGNLYGGRGAGTPWFYGVSQSTGLASLIGDSGLGYAAMSALTVRRSDGVVFASVNIAGDGGTGADHLAIVNKATGHATVIGPYGTCNGVPTPAAGGLGSCTIEGIEGIAFDPHGNLWGVHSTRGRAGPAGLYRINPATGAATFMGSFIDAGTGAPFAGNVVSLATTPGGFAFAGTSRSAPAASDAGYLLKIDLSTRVVTRIGRSILTGSALAGLTFPR
ncbi:MAG TPA: hypothetical protein VFO55_02960 [Gemmatimonadaceae bacterium]|nr:hypothetical protein [Gemmatimonadaceae bacterium]